MRNKEEIFAEAGIQDIEETQFPYQIKDAMDEYAKEVAIDFGKWLNNNYYMDYDGFYHHAYQNKKHYSIEELFEEYKNQ